MFKRLLILIPAALFFGAMQVQAMTNVLPAVVGTKSAEAHSPNRMLSERTMSLKDRYAVPSVNAVFRDNILLTVAYMSGSVKNAGQINWDAVRKPAQYTMILQPGEVFAFHDDVLSQYAGKKVVTTSAHFDGSEGFVSDGYLYGDGVCHFASLINWAARDAGLNVVAPVNHDFAVIPDIPREYGTAIYSSPGESEINQQQNLYVENIFDKPVMLVFTTSSDAATVQVYK